MVTVLSRKLVALNDDVLAHWCPSCDRFHLVYINRLNHFEKMWVWNGDVNLPTFQPNLGTPTRCHYRITDGNIEYLPDSSHLLSGKIVSMPDLPPNLDDLSDAH